MQPRGSASDQVMPVTPPDAPPPAAPAGANNGATGQPLPVRSRRGKPEAAVADYRPGRLALRGVDGYLTHSQGEITAWFVEPPVAWSMRSLDVRERRIAARALRLAELVERDVPGVHQRVVHRPWPVQQWGRDFDAWAHSGVTAPPADVPGALSWSELVVGEQHAQLRRPAASKSVYWGVPLSRRSGLAKFLEWGAGASAWAGPVHRVLAGHMDAVLDRELADLAEELADLAQVMSSFGIQAQPATADQMQWLLWRSATLGLPAPQLTSSPNDTWTLSDLGTLVDAAEVVAEPLRDCVQVTGVVDGHRWTRYVAVLTVGRMGELAIPEQSLPWQVWGDALAPVEQSVRLRFPTPQAVRRSLDRQISRIVNQERHITVEHGLECPPDIQDKIARATLIKNEIDSDHTKLATRVEGWWRMAVSALTAEEVLRAAADLRKRYAPNILLEQAEGQYQQYREFMPHEPLSSTAHRRRMSVRLAAAGLASVTDRLGDRHGPNVAETASLSRRPVNWDMWFAQEQLDKSGLTPVVGGLGSGKTHLCGMCVYKAVRTGAHGIVLDPSGPLRKLAALPELAPYTRLIDLMEAPPGTLNPYRVIVDPRRTDFPPADDGQARYDAELRAVAADRKTFVADVLRMLLPWHMQQSPAVRRVMDKAVDQVGGRNDRDPGEVIDRLRDIAADAAASADTREAAEDAARKLAELQPHRQVRLLFPQPGIDGWADLADARLTILTMPGVQLPKFGTDPGTWSLQQQLGMPLLHLASWLTHRLIYEVPREVRKIVFLDEGKYLSGSSAGQTLYARLERDTRKYNVRALIASQLPDDFLALPGFEALTHEVIIGALTGAKVQAAALKLLRLEPDAGWQDLLASLNSQGGLVESTHDPDALAAQHRQGSTPREYLMRIGDDVEVVRVDYGTSPHLAHVVAALNSNPTADLDAHPDAGTGP